MAAAFLPNALGGRAERVRSRDRPAHTFHRRLGQFSSGSKGRNTQGLPNSAVCEPWRDRPAAVTLYSRDGQVLSHTGSSSNLNRITRPVNHGNPFAYKSLFHRPSGATGKH
jgi:hypothetical protein